MCRFNARVTSAPEISTIGAENVVARESAETSWRDTQRDQSLRQSVVAKIVNLLRSKVSDHGDVNINETKLIGIAKKLEDGLYSNAASLDAYRDPTSLRKRLQEYAVAKKREVLEQRSSVSTGSAMSPSKSSCTSASLVQTTAEEDARQLKLKQDRLVLLRHASRCKCEDCSTPHCAAMKSVWQHLITCSDSECSVQYCLSSKSLLSHHSLCRDLCCNLCQPARIAACVELTESPIVRASQNVLYIKQSGNRVLQTQRTSSRRAVAHLPPRSVARRRVDCLEYSSRKRDRSSSDDVNEMYLDQVRALKCQRLNESVSCVSVLVDRLRMKGHVFDWDTEYESEDDNNYY